MTGGNAPRRKTHRKAAALARFALDPQAGLVSQERVLDNREPETRSARLARSAAVHAVEALGEPRDVLRFDSDATVRYGKGRAVRRKT